MKHMTVKELKTELDKFDENQDIIVEIDGMLGVGHVASVGEVNAEEYKMNFEVKDGKAAIIFCDIVIGGV